MKRKLSLLLAMVLAMTMVMGIGVTAMAADHPDEYNIPVYDPEGEVAYWAKNEELRVVETQDEKKVTYWVVNGYYESQSFYTYCLEDSQGQVYVCYPDGAETKEIIINMLEPTMATMTKAELYSAMQIGALSMYYENYEDLCIYGWNAKIGPASTTENSSSPAHVHNFQWQTITEPTKDADGLEGEVCSCGATKNTQKLSAYGYALNQYATPMINAAKAGQTITFEFGEWNSFPKSFMAKLVDKSAQNVTFVFKYKWNHKLQTITIPAGTPIDLNFDWYGPAKMAELYGAN